LRRLLIHLNGEMRELRLEGTHPLVGARRFTHAFDK
jgi:hypothetical protein